MQGRKVSNQTGTTVTQGAFDGGRVRVLGITCAIQRGTELVRQPSLVGGAVVDVQNQVAQAKTLQSPDHCIDGGTLLCHEQGPLTFAGQRRDQVGDRLALAGARRSLDDEVGTASHGVDDSLLGRVGVEDEVLTGRVGVGRGVRARGSEPLDGGGAPRQRRMHRRGGLRPRRHGRSGRAGWRGGARKPSPRGPVRGSRWSPAPCACGVLLGGVSGCRWSCRLRHRHRRHPTGSVAGRAQPWLHRAGVAPCSTSCARSRCWPGR